MRRRFGGRSWDGWAPSVCPTAEALDELWRRPSPRYCAIMRDADLLGRRGWSAHNACLNAL